MKKDLSEAINAAVLTIEKEFDALRKLGKLIRSDQFRKTIELIMQSNGKVVIIGLGKSGLVGSKIAATLSSIGVSSIFLHAADALHGDMGAVKKEDVAILISKSGETKELSEIISFLNDNGNSKIAITASERSTLAGRSDILLKMDIESEGCPINLLPMASTTATLALGDAISSALIVALNFKPELFARYHPGGKLGFMLTKKISDIVDLGRNPVGYETDTMQDGLIKLVEYKFGALSIVDKNGVLKGLLTDGDIKRIIIKNDQDLLSQPISRYMTKNPQSINVTASAAEALDIMEKRKSEISTLPVLDKNQKPIAMLRLHDIIKAHY